MRGGEPPVEKDDRVSCPDWPLPLDPDKHCPEAVDRRRRVLEIYRRLDERCAHGPNLGRRGPDNWQRHVYGDGLEGGS